MKIFNATFCLFFVLISSHLSAQTTFEEAFPNLRFTFPVELIPSNDGTNRLFLVQQDGLVYGFPNDPEVDETQRNVFLDLRSQVGYRAGSELGLLGMAFHPNYRDNGFCYFYYTSGIPNGFNSFARIRIVRFQVDPNNANQLDPTSETILIDELKNIPFSNHNGGKIAFGPDGYLYASVGDGGGGGDPAGNGQDVNNIFGKILRIDVDLDGSNPLVPGGAYEIPSDNPLVNQEGEDEIYAWGIRNTWKFSFDPLTNQLWGADVGQNAFEEINLVTIGGNYGWNRFEAESIEDGSTQVTDPIFPIFFYDHNQGDVSITGGYVYRGNENPDLIGKYIYGDFATGRVWALSYNSSNQQVQNTFLFRANGNDIPTFGLDEAGEIYFTNYSEDARIFKIVSGSSTPGATVINGKGNWTAFDPGSNGLVRTVVQDNQGMLYVGGTFSEIGGISANNLASWDETNGWQSLATGANGAVNALALAPNGDLFVGGEFTSIGGQNANYIALWDGQTFSSLADGTNGPIAALQLGANGGLYAGGTFETTGTLEVNNIAFWNNGIWQALSDQSTGVAGTNNEIRSLALAENGDLYAGGNFLQAGGVFASSIARWDGSNWTGLGDGTSGFVQAIEINQNYIYAGGNFALAGAQTVNRIARWNRQSESWEALGNGLSGSVNALQLVNDTVYVGGSFSDAFPDSIQRFRVNNLARWSAAGAWEALGEGNQVGANGPVNTLLFDQEQGRLYAGGNFTEIGRNSNAADLAFWEETVLTSLALFPQNSLMVYPNPVQDKVSVFYRNLPVEELLLDIFDANGRLLFRDYVVAANEMGRIDIMVNRFRQSVLILKISGGRFRASYRLIVSR